MTWGIVAGAAVGVVGSAMSSKAAGDAADTQAQSAANATGEQRRQFDLNRQDLAPFMQTGTAANKKLAALLGLSGSTSSGGTAGRPYTLEDFQAYNDRIAPNHGFGAAGRASDANDQYLQYTTGSYGNDQNAIAQRFGFDPSRIAAAQQETAATEADPSFGSLLRKFSKSDLEADPVYQSGLQFGLDQGTGAINARAIAGGGYDSGATLKALTRYANDYGSTKANESFNRYNIANDSIYNKLAGVSGAGQQATNQAVSSGTGIANNISGLTTDAGNARAAGIIGGANAWGDAASAVGKGINNYNTNQWLKSLTAKNASPYTSGVNMGTATGADMDVYY